MSTPAPDFFTVDWSYPTSGNATRAKCPQGCWTVSQTFITGSHVRSVALASGFATREAAQQFADSNMHGVRQLRANASKE